MEVWNLNFLTLTHCSYIWFHRCYKNAIRLCETLIASDSGNLGFSWWITEEEVKDLS